MSMMRTITGMSAVASVWLASTGSAAAQTDEQLASIREALPSEAVAKPKQPRRLLVFSATRGFRHSSIPVGIAALRLMGEKTGAYELLASEDIAVFEQESLKTFDAVCLLNTTGELFLPADFEKLETSEKSLARERDRKLKQNLTDFVIGGKGLAGIHAATDTFYQWPWYGDTVGGYFDGHPWCAGDDVVIKVDDKDHPLTKHLAGEPLEFKEEIYQLRDPYSRARQRVLLSLDTSKTDMTKPGIKRKDGDFGVSWVRTESKGRIFYCSLGHNEHIYWNQRVLRHYLAGIQFALGDLEVETKPTMLIPPEVKGKPPMERP